MRGRYLGFGGLVVLLVLLAVGVHQLASAQPRPPQQPARTTAANPHARLTDAQRQTAIATVRAQTRAIHDAWLQDFVQRGRDPRTLPRQPLLAFYDMPVKDLATATATANAIVVGTVRSTRFALGEVDVMTFVTFAVERTLKGTVGAEVTIRQLGGPSPTSGQVGSPGVLLYAENTPVLLAGDRAILFLQRVGTSDTYDVQNSTGGYRIEAGKVRAVDSNPFRLTATGRPSRTSLPVCSGWSRIEQGDVRGIAEVAGIAGEEGEVVRERRCRHQYIVGSVLEREPQLIVSSGRTTALRR